MYMEHGGTSKKWVWHTILHLDVVFFLFAGSVKSFGCVRSLGNRTSNITNTIFKRRDWMVEPIWGSILAELVLICSSCVHDSFQTTFKIQRAPLSHTISDVSHETPLKSWRHGPDHCRDSLLLAFWTTCVFASTNETKLQIVQDSQVQYRVSERYEFDPLPGILMLWSPWSHTRTLIRWRFAWDLQFNCQPFLQFDRVSSHVAPWDMDIPPVRATAMEPCHGEWASASAGYFALLNRPSSKQLHLWP